MIFLKAWETAVLATNSRSPVAGRPFQAIKHFPEDLSGQPGRRHNGSRRISFPRYQKAAAALGRRCNQPDFKVGTRRAIIPAK